MLREFKRVYTATRNNHVEIRTANRDDNGPWEWGGIAPYPHTVAEMMLIDAERMTRFGWTLYDQEEPNVLVGWKEF